MRFSRTAVRTVLRTWTALLFIAPLSTGARAQSGAQRGYLFIVGGGPQSAEMVQRFIDLAGGKKAKIVVFAMASSDGKESGEEKADDLRKLDAEAHRAPG